VDLESIEFTRSSDGHPRISEGHKRLIFVQNALKQPLSANYLIELCRSDAERRT